MKTSNLILFTLLLFLTGFVSCQKPVPIETDFTLMRDITGSTYNTKIDITLTKVLDLFDLSNNPFNYGRFRTSVLSDVHLGTVQQVKIKPVKSMHSYNRYLREAEIGKFQKGVDSLITNLTQLESGKLASSIFIPLSKELKRLSISSAQNKVLICYTNLFENSDALFSAYSDIEFSQLEKTPEKLATILSKKAPLPDDLYGIKIFIIYNPILKTDSDFLAISKWYKKLLESKGADEVFIGANLIIE